MDREALERRLDVIRAELFGIECRFDGSIPPEFQRRKRELEQERSAIYKEIA